MIENLELQGVLLITPRVFEDERGCFFETFSEKNLDVHFVQDNESHSHKGVVRGLHFQKEPDAQAKLVRVVSGRILDVAVDMRASSKTFGQWVAVELSGENRRQLFIPRGFAHGFVALEESTVVYKVDGFYAPQSDAGVLWSSVGIDWGVTDPIVSAKDQALPALADAYRFP